MGLQVNPICFTQSKRRACKGDIGALFSSHKLYKAGTKGVLHCFIYSLYRAYSNDVSLPFPIKNKLGKRAKDPTCRAIIPFSNVTTK